MLLELDNVFSIFAGYLGAELKTKTAVTPLNVHDGLLLDSTIIIRNNSANCNTETQDGLRIDT